MLVDSHCHLDLLKLDAYPNQLEVVLHAAREAGVQHILTVAVDIKSYQQGIAVAERYPQISASMGIHPLHKQELLTDLCELSQLASHSQVVAIGETGLDYHYQPDNKASQQDSFRQHIAVAIEQAKPLIVHTRAAKQDTLAALKTEGKGQVKGVMHCFTEDWDMARQALDLGFYISFSGIVTFKDATDLQAVAKQVPLDRMLVETDAPYLTPVPFRGKSNEPKYVRQVAEYIAELRAIPFIELAQATTDNFFRLFDKAQR
jgi:TatD DNase family protein